MESHDDLSKVRGIFSYQSGDFIQVQNQDQLQINSLLVTHQLQVAYSIQTALKDDQYQTNQARSKKEAQLELSDNSYDLCLLDLALPRHSGFSLAGLIEDKYPGLPKILITSAPLSNRSFRNLKLSNAQAIALPIDNRELQFKIRSFEKSIENRRLCYGTEDLGIYKFNIPNKELLKQEERVKITTRESELLQELVRHKNKVVKRESLLRSIWGKNDYFLGRSMDVIISRLRKHLSDEPAVRIENIHGVGYRLMVLAS